MIKKIAYTLLIFGFIGLSANAYTSQDEMYSEEAMINYGYSKDFVEVMQKLHAKSNGLPYDYHAEEDPVFTHQPFKALKRVIYYFDPASDNSQFLNHDIKPYPSFTDY